MTVWFVFRLGIGLFANEFIPNGAIYRRVIRNKNLIVFTKEEDLPPLTDSTLEYIENYTFQMGGICGKILYRNMFVSIQNNELSIHNYLLITHFVITFYKFGSIMSIWNETNLTESHIILVILNSHKISIFWKQWVGYVISFMHLP